LEFDFGGTKGSGEWRVTSGEKRSSKREADRRWPDKIAILKIEEAITVTLKLKPEVEAGLLTQAQASGMTLEEYLLSMVEGAGASEGAGDFVGGRARGSVEAWSAGHRPTPLLSDYAVSREAMYEGRND
jgi:hypothetical protein